MKQIIILLVVFILGLSLGYAGNTLMTLRKVFSPSAPSQSVSEQKADIPTGSGTKNTPTDAVDTPVTIPKELVTIPASTLTPGQKELLSKLGIDPNKIVVTPGMVTCAEDTLGSARVSEIVAGGTPSALEAVRLSPCLNK